MSTKVPTSPARTSFFETTTAFARTPEGRKRCQTAEFELLGSSSKILFPPDESSLGGGGGQRQRLRATSDSFPLGTSQGNSYLDFGPGSSSSSSSSSFPIQSGSGRETSSSEETLARTINLLSFNDDHEGEIGHQLRNQPLFNRRLLSDSPRLRSLSASFSIEDENSRLSPIPFARTISSMAVMTTELSEGLHLRQRTSSSLQEQFQTPPLSLSPSPSQEPETPSATILSSVEYSNQPSRSLWVGNIDFNVSVEEMSNIFSQFGNVESVKYFKDFAFVNFQNLDDALTAKENMQGAKIGNFIVKIGFGKWGDVQDFEVAKSLWVGNISLETKPEDLVAVFAQFGRVESARMLLPKNCAFVKFVSIEDATRARNVVTEQCIFGPHVKIGFAKVPSRVQPYGLVSAEVVPAPSTSSARMNIRKAAAASATRSTSSAILPIPDINSSRKPDQNRLKELRKRLDSEITIKEFDVIFQEIIGEASELCSDHVGNVLIQQVMERGTEQQRLVLIKKTSSMMAALGVHKNGTYAVQKMIECSRTDKQLDAIVLALSPYAPSLLMDQFGNYVIQCCLSKSRNQFIFDAISSNILSLGKTRFGARSIKSCLESIHTSDVQRNQVAGAILKNCVSLASSSNGAILVNWLIEGSTFPGKFREITDLMLPHVSSLCCNKTASTVIMKLIQKLDLETRTMLLKVIFDDASLDRIVADQSIGHSFITKLLASGTVVDQKLMKKVKKVILRSGSGKAVEEFHHHPTPAQSPSYRSTSRS